MNATVYRLTILIQPLGKTVVLERVSAEETASGLIAAVLKQLGETADAEGWTLSYQGRPLPLRDRLGGHLPDGQDTVALVMMRHSRTGFGAPAPTAPGGGMRREQAPPAPATAAPPPAASVSPQPRRPAADDYGMEVEEDACLDEEVALSDAAAAPESAAIEDEGVAAPSSRAAKPGTFARTRSTATRRATVRHYNRMNPMRLYPLLVLINKEMVAKIQKANTDQRTSAPMELDLDAPVEIEPILPGVDCYPPRIVTRLSGGEVQAVFRVVPRMLGRVDGAMVAIRQDHAALAEIPLDMKVAHRFWVAFFGLLTFLLPGVSTAFKHFGLDFETGSFSVFLAAARFIFNVLTPLGLAAVLGLVTVLFWWFTRPRSGDVFFEIQKLGPAEELRRVAAAFKADAFQAAQDLNVLLTMYPDYQPARLYFAEWHYRSQNYGAALREFQIAFRLGAGKARHYHQAALAASNQMNNALAVRLLQDAEKTLAASEMTGAMFYNLGCYLARCADPVNAMHYLRKAVDAGYVKEESFRNDPDLMPLRLRADFRELLAAVGAG